MTWKRLGRIAPTELLDARLQLHHAAQVVASAGITYLEPQPDDSHPNLGWVEDLGALIGRALPGSDARVGLRPSDVSLVLVERSGRAFEELALEGKTLEQGYAWLAEAIVGAGSTLPAAGLTRSSYEIPDHRVGRGERFSSSPGGGFAELAAWFANGHQVLGELAARTPGASELRCWPHHFDLGALVVVETAADGSLRKSIGIGLSPGDEGYAEPYWYVSPWPYPEPSSLPPLGPVGRWHTHGYTAAILTGSELVDGSFDDQSERLDVFLAAALDASRRALAI